MEAQQRASEKVSVEVSGWSNGSSATLKDWLGAVVIARYT